MGAKELGKGGALGRDTPQARLGRAGPGEGRLVLAARPRPIPSALMDWLVRRALCTEPIRKHLPR